jgi:hypothetical protein
VITAAQIAHLRKAGDDYAETERMKARLARLRDERDPLFLTASEFHEILRWKLRTQLNRQFHIRTANTDSIIRHVTGSALTITSDDKDYEIELRVNILCALRGVAVPVASAVLALVYPNDYAVIDFRGWRQVFGPAPDKIFSITDYKRYLRALQPLVRELGWPIQEVDFAIWEYDRRQGRT